VISAPSAWTASIVHDFALVPSTWTVHAPQLLVSQPMWVPVRPNVVAQEVDEEEARFDVGLAGLAVDGDRDVLVVMLPSPVERKARARWRRGGPDGQLGDHRALVVAGTADVRPAGSLAPRPRRRHGTRPRRALPDEDRSALGRANGEAETPVMPIPACRIAPSSREHHVVDTPAVAKSPTRRSSFW
jgi:hypothetical protein